MCRLPAGSALPASLSSGPDDKSVISVTWAPDELSVICPADRVPEGATVEASWRGLRVIGPLADARVNIVAFSTYDTDYLLIPQVRLTEAVDTLTAAGHRLASA